MLSRQYKTCQMNGYAKTIINDPWFNNLLLNVIIYCRLHIHQILITNKKEENKKKWEFNQLSNQ